MSVPSTPASTSDRMRSSHAGAAVFFSEGIVSILRLPAAAGVPGPTLDAPAARLSTNGEATPPGAQIVRRKLNIPAATKTPRHPVPEGKA